MELETIQIKNNNPLVDAFFNNFSEVSELFTYDPRQRESFQKRMEVVNNKYTIDREQLVLMLKNYNQKLGCGEKNLS